MTASLPTARPGAWVWMARRRYTVGVLLLFAVVAVPFLTRRYSEWEAVYVRAAQRLGSGEPLYRPAHGYLYPPFMAWTALPFTHLPPGAGRWVWLAVNLACLACIFRGSWRLAGGAPLQGERPAAWPEQAACLLGALCALPHLQNCLAHQQTDVVIGALLVGGCLLWVRRHALSAATLLGLAAACKCTALLWAPYFLYRRHPLAAAWLVVVAVGANLLPDLTLASPGQKPLVREYADTFLRPMTRKEHVAGTWGSELIYNQSLAGAGQRWLRTTWQWGPNATRVTTRPDAAGPGTVRWAVHGMNLAAVLLVLLLAGRPFSSLPGEGEGGSVPQAAREGGLVLALMLLLSPMSSKAHFGVLLVPAFCLARAALVGHGVRTTARAWGMRGCLAVALLLALVANKDLLGGRLYTVALWYGSATWQALALFAGGLLALPPRTREETKPRNTRKGGDNEENEEEQRTPRAA